MLIHAGTAEQGNLASPTKADPEFFSTAYVGDMRNAWDQINFFFVWLVLLLFIEKKHTHTQSEAYQLGALSCFLWVCLSGDPSHLREALIPSHVRQQHTAKPHSAHGNC